MNQRPLGCKLEQFTAQMLRLPVGLIVATSVFFSGCISKHEQEVVAYVSLDEEFSSPILKQFESKTSIHVLPKYDIESTKTVGLTTAIMQERDRPRCDVFWNNEILHTLRLEREGFLEAHLPPAAGQWPNSYRSTSGTWIGFAARARVLVVNTELVAKEERPTSILDLADKKWRGKVGLAKPLFGTTATHAAVLFATWGDERSLEYFSSVRENAAIASGNKQVAIDVAAGRLAFGLTDTDDAIVELEKGAPIEIVFPDQQGLGTLFIPNTVSIIKGCRHPDQARKLVDYLLSPEVEQALAEGPSAQFPVNPTVSIRSRVRAPDDVRWMEADFRAAAESWETAARRMVDIFGR